MMYRKPELLDYPAIVVVQTTGPIAKTLGNLEPDTICRTSPAHQADE
jgi:hypothetical protein